jgi:hypothetical protein
MNRESRAPLIVALVLLLLPVLYVGSYLALVMPAGRIVLEADAAGNLYGRTYLYRAGKKYSSVVFWPLEQIDRKVRPGTWQPQYQTLPYARP